MILSLQLSHIDWHPNGRTYPNAVGRVESRFTLTTQLMRRSVNYRPTSPEHEGTGFADYDPRHFWRFDFRITRNYTIDEAGGERPSHYISHETEPRQTIG